jgi:hypothetical protein
MKSIKVGKPGTYRLFLEDQAAFDALPGTRSEKIRAIVHENLVGNMFSPTEQAWLAHQPPEWFPEQVRLLVAEAMRLEQERAELQVKRLLGDR